eukprot:14650082-Alexandrium_andersonii.AAC.1
MATLGYDAQATRAPMLHALCAHARVNCATTWQLMHTSAPTVQASHVDILPGAIVTRGQPQTFTNA